MNTFTNYTRILFFSFFMFLNSCSSDDGTPNSLPTITTLTAQNISGSNVTLGGTISDAGGSTILRRGVCWGTTDNPVIGVGNFQEDNLDQTGSFSFSVILEQNTSYYARAYAENAQGIQYGNTVTFTTQQFVATDNPVDILTTKAILKGQKSVAGDAIVGFVYSTNHQPTINDNNVYASISGISPYQIAITGLTSNTTYYVRAYSGTSDSAYAYGVETEFKTAGYFGTGGGYVAYDKGAVTDGWRYLEVHPTTLSYNIASTTGSAWGNAGVFVAGTTDPIGAGPDNTTAIVAGVSQANCAAKLCQNLVLNGKSDWFLGSSQEMLLVTQSMYDIGIVIGTGGDIWTSTQTDASTAKVISFSIPPTIITINSIPKSYPNVNVLPMRRY